MGNDSAILFQSAFIVQVLFIHHPSQISPSSLTDPLTLVGAAIPSTLDHLHGVFSFLVTSHSVRSAHPIAHPMPSLVKNGIGEHPAAQNTRASSQRCCPCAHTGTGVLLVLWRALLVLWRALLVLRVFSWQTYHHTQTRAKSDMLHTSAATVPRKGSLTMCGTDL